jgi:hypothetical protein
VDEEARYFEYVDWNILLAAFFLAQLLPPSIMSSIIALYSVENMLVGLGIVAAYGDAFPLVLILARSVR